MLSLLAILWTGFSVGLSGAMIPGPMLVFCVSRVMRGGFFEGVKMVFGHFLVEIAVIALILFGVSRISESSPLMRGFGIMGGALIYLYGGVVMKGAKSASLAVQTGGVEARYGSVAGGAAFSLFNPMFIIWWLSLGAGVIVNVLRESGWLGIAVYVAGHELSDLGWYAFVAYSVDRGRTLMNDRVYQGILTALGVSLALIGAWFLAPWLAG